MTTYTARGFSTFWDSSSNAETLLRSDLELEVTASRGATFSFSVLNNDNGFQDVAIYTGAAQILVNGENIDLLSAEASLTNMHWSQGVTGLLYLSIPQGEDFVDYYFDIGGTTLPIPQSTSEYFGFADLISGFSPVTVTLPANVNHSWSVLDVESTENDRYLGTRGNDQIGRASCRERC